MIKRKASLLLFNQRNALQPYNFPMSFLFTTSPPSYTQSVLGINSYHRGMVPTMLFSGNVVSLLLHIIVGKLAIDKATLKDLFRTLP